MSTVIEKKEHADEARYIREIEARRQAEIRANLDRIMALADNHEEKTAIVDLLEKKEKPSLMSQMSSWKYAIPITVLLATPAINNEFLVMDGEFQLTACFMLFCATFYTQGGEMLHKALSSYRSEVQTKLTTIDDAIKEQMQAAQEADKFVIAAEEDIVDYYNLKDSMRIVQAESLTNQEAHKYREAVVKKLDSLYALEEAASNAIRARMINKVQSDVVNTFKTDQKAKENALNQAMAVLAGGANAKMGKDVVGELFKSSLVSYKTAYSKLPAGSDEILKKLEEDMAAVAVAPVVDSKGGNVYMTHPL
jgi:hypothetical protein